MDVRIKYNKGKIMPLDEEHSSALNKTQAISPGKERTMDADNKELNAEDLIFFNRVKKDALRWKSYACCRRMQKSNKTSSCLGLYKLKKMTDEMIDKPDGRNIKEFLNHKLINYFAKLGKSTNENETVDLEYVKNLLKSGGDINSTDKYGQTILHEVARAWHTDVALYVIKKGANVNQGDNYGRTPLHVAAAVDYVPMVDLLLKHKADIEAKTKDELQTPVFYAAKNDAVNSLKALVKKKCKFIDIQDYKERTPIYVAAELDRSETTKLLLELNAPGYSSANDGSRAITWMINKMPPVAFEALNQMHSTDRPNRKQYYSLNYLFCEKVTSKNISDHNVSGSSQTSLHVAVGLRQYDLIMHPVFKRLLDVMWDQYGKRSAIFHLCLNLIYILLWTIIGLVVEYDKRHYYDLPGDTWRIVLFILAALLTFYQIYEEIMEFRRSQDYHDAWETKRKGDIKNDLEYCHPRWPGEKKYLLSEIAELENLRPKYFNDAWNIFDWICYIFLLICMATHIADIIDHSEVLAKVHIRIMAITIILLWLRLMKHARAFALLGPFIVMLGHMLKDCVRFLFLYMEFYIPYLTAFWMIFGGTKMAADNSTEEVTVSGFTYPGEIFFSTFRLTLVDDYDYDNMQKIDSIMADLLLGTWFMLSAILCLNLFIALLSDTFQRVYDNAQANSVMQRAIFLVNIWEGMSRKRKEQFLDYIDEFCSPLKDEYDDDMTQTGEEDLKRITFQIKENLDDLQELFKLQFGDPRSHLTEDEENTSKERRNQLFKPNSDVEEIKQTLISFQTEQLNITSQMQKDLLSVKNMLQQSLSKQIPDFQSACPVSESLENVGYDNEKLGKKKRRRKKEKHFKGFGSELQDHAPASFQNFTSLQDQSQRVNVNESTNC
uniref:Ion transport domain-containing protein n=1 Tax=Biomphalaria glabrata TaxID=6526 RepID=A0A2C9M2V5_BIOGL